VPSFARAAVYVAGPGLASVASGDLNGDGRSDLVTANYWNDTDNVSVLLNRGDGSFRARRNHPTGKSPYSVAVADVNGDGRADVVTANRDANTVSVLLGDGRGGFKAHVDYPTGRWPSDIAIGDHGDGSADLVTANARGNTISVLLNVGDGSFGAGAAYRTAPSPQSVAVGDLDGDRKPDVAVATWANDLVSVLLNKGDGTLGPRVDRRAGSGPRSIAIDDLNGDRRPDLVTANHNVNSDSVSVFLNEGGGRLALRVNYRLYVIFSLAVGDLNGDGRDDIAIAPLSSDRVSVLLNRRDGTFGASYEYGTGPRAGGGAPRSIATGDLNGDRRTDLVPVGETSVSVLLAVEAPPCVVPQLRGQTLVGARSALARARCRVGRIEWYPDRDVPYGRVLGTDPAPPRVLPGGGRVDLSLSKGR
jgi:hypothetical protein